MQHKPYLNILAVSMNKISYLHCHGIFLFNFLEIITLAFYFANIDLQKAV